MTYSLEDFIKEKHGRMLKHLEQIVAEYKGRMLKFPGLYTDPDSSEPSVDVRLCIEYTGNGQGGDWAIYTGDVSYDPKHYSLCGAGSIDLNTNTSTLLDDLIDQILTLEARP